MSNKKEKKQEIWNRQYRISSIIIKKRNTIWSFITLIKIFSAKKPKLKPIIKHHYICNTKFSFSDVKKMIYTLELYMKLTVNIIYFIFLYFLHPNIYVICAYTWKHIWIIIFCTWVIFFGVIFFIYCTLLLL